GVDPRDRAVGDAAGTSAATVLRDRPRALRAAHAVAVGKTRRARTTPSRLSGVAPPRGGRREILDAERTRDDARRPARRLAAHGAVARILLAELRPLSATCRAAPCPRGQGIRHDRKPVRCCFVWPSVETSHQSRETSQ